MISYMVITTVALRNILNVEQVVILVTSIIIYADTNITFGVTISIIVVNNNIFVNYVEKNTYVIDGIIEVPGEILIL